MEPFKNKLSPALVSCIANHLSRHLPSVDATAFENRILSELDQLELKQRAQLISDQLHAVLPSNFKRRNKILAAMMHPKTAALSEQESDEHGICGWGMMPLCMVVGQHGLSEFEASLALLREMTSRFTAEFDVRPFLIADQNKALQIMAPWVEDPDEHVRRLFSEGTRPRLPWGQRLQALVVDPSPMIPYLTALRDDPSEYVRRSVANHLNDIAKDHPDLVADIAADWLQGADKNRERLVRHACRSLIKQGHPATLKAFGLGPPLLELNFLRIDSPSIELGDSLQFEASISSTSNTAQSLVIDYLLHFKKANGSLSAKVFKWKKFELADSETIKLQKKHALRAVTTRRYYSGQQQLSLRINGQDFALESFDLKVPDEK